MLSRDTRVQVVVALFAFALLLLAQRAGLSIDDGPIAAVFFVLFYGLIFGGAHLVLAIRGEDGMIPVDARWRYLAALGIVLAGGALVYVGEGYAIGPLTVRTLGTAVVAVTAIAYIVLEGIAGYRDTQTRAS